MSKWIEVPVTIYRVYAVEVADSETLEDAMRYAQEDCMTDTLSIGICTVAKNEAAAQTMRCCADEVLKL